MQTWIVSICVKKIANPKCDVAGGKHICHLPSQTVVEKVACVLVDDTLDVVLDKHDLVHWMWTCAHNLQIKLQFRF